MAHVAIVVPQNHTIERMWVEVNKRINYPIKEALVDMESKGDINMDDQLHQFCSSWLALHVSNAGAKYFVASWNAHPIPGTVEFADNVDEYGVVVYRVFLFTHQWANGYMNMPRGAAPPPPPPRYHAQGCPTHHLTHHLT